MSSKRESALVDDQRMAAAERAKAASKEMTRVMPSVAVDRMTRLEGNMTEAMNLSHALDSRRLAGTSGVKSIASRLPLA